MPSFSAVVNEHVAARRAGDTAEASFDRGESSAFPPPPPPVLELALARAKARLPHGADGKRYSFWTAFKLTLAVVRTLGVDAACYMRVIQEGLLATLLALLCSLPAMLYNMGMFTEANYEAEYGAYVAAGQLTEATDDGVWTVNASFPGCTLGVGAPLTWGKPGGSTDLLGAAELSWVHVVSDALSLTVFLIFLCRSQHLLLLHDSVIDVTVATLATREKLADAAAEASALFQAHARMNTCTRAHKHMHICTCARTHVHVQYICTHAVRGDHLPPTTYHLPPTTCHLPPATTYHLPPTTHQLPALLLPCSRRARGSRPTSSATKRARGFAL